MSLNHKGEEIFLKLKKAVSLFRDFSDNEIKTLLRVANVKRYQQNQVIFREKDPGESMYIVLSGAVKIHRRFPHGGEQVLGSVEAGSFFGEMGMIDGSPRSAQATCRVDSLLLYIDQSILKNAPSIIMAKVYRNFALILSERLKTANKKLHDLDSKAKGVERREERREREGPPAQDE